jgi:hypothetical protein
LQAFAMGKPPRVGQHLRVPRRPRYFPRGDAVLCTSRRQGRLRVLANRRQNLSDRLGAANARPGATPAAICWLVLHTTPVESDCVCALINLPGVPTGQIPGLLAYLSYSKEQCCTGGSPYYCSGGTPPAASPFQLPAALTARCIPFFFKDRVFGPVSSRLAGWLASFNNVQRTTFHHLQLRGCWCTYVRTGVRWLLLNPLNPYSTPLTLYLTSPCPLKAALVVAPLLPLLMSFSSPSMPLPLLMATA